ncbi:MAG: hypothetical protein L3K24_09870 [Gammaproteobacteria bacterium]|nr:hypothetical protein [Gammaproteobacteria bacterium]
MIHAKTNENQTLTGLAPNHQPAQAQKGRIPGLAADIGDFHTFFIRPLTVQWFRIHFGHLEAKKSSD